jgi:hypothetical protein
MSDRSVNYENESEESNAQGSDLAMELDAKRKATWELITTAPKDGTKVLLAWPGIINMGRYNAEDEEWIAINTGERFYPEAPLYWMPLPTAPKEPA